MSTFTYPTSAALREIEQDLLPRLTNDDPIFKLFPIVNEDHHLLKWEQLDNYVGLQQLRGLNGQPGRVKKTGLRTYEMKPGVYGEFELIDEEELTIRRKMATAWEPISIDDLVGMAMDKLTQREIDIIRLILWTLVSTGTFSIASPTGGVIHTDTFDLVPSDGSDWSTHNTATPLKDLRAAKLLQRGSSVSFGSGAQAFMNQNEVNNLLLNTNISDLGGKFVNNGSSILALEDINKILLSNDLPQIVPMDDGYLDEDENFQLFIPDDVVVIVGKRTSGASLGEYRMTRNANNPDMGPGSYTKIIDRGEDSVPRSIEVHRGHNGGPVIFFGSGVIILDVGA